MEGLQPLGDDWLTSQIIRDDPDIDSIFFNVSLTDPEPSEHLTVEHIRSVLDELREAAEDETYRRHAHVEAAAREARLKDMGLLVSKDMRLVEVSEHVPAGTMYIVDTSRWVGPLARPMHPFGSD